MTFDHILFDSYFEMKNCPTLKRYMTILPEPNPEKQKESIDRLKNSIKIHKNNQKKLKLKFQKKKYREANPIFSKNYPVLSYLCSYYKKISKVKNDYEIEKLQNSIDIENFLIKVIEKNKCISFDSNRYIEETNKANSAKEEYKQLIMHKNLISKQISLLDLKTDAEVLAGRIKHDLINCAKDFVEETSYSPPSILDHLITMFIRLYRTKTIVTPLANFISFGSSKNAIISIGEFSKEIYKGLGVTNPVHQVMVYTSIIRFLFDESYVIHSDLNENKEENIKFLERCNQFSKQSAKGLKLSDDIKSYYTPGSVSYTHLTLPTTERV